MTIQNYLHTSPFIRQKPLQPSIAIKQRFGFSFASLSLRTRQFYQSYIPSMPSSVKNFKQMTGKVLWVSSQVTFKAFLCLGKNMVGCKPFTIQQVIEVNQQRLSQQDEDFAIFCTTIVDQAVEAFLQHEEQIKEKFVEATQDYISALSLSNEQKEEISVGESSYYSNSIQGLKGYFFDQASKWAGKKIEAHKELIAKTIQANLLNVFANLLEEASKNPSTNETQTSFSKIFVLIGRCLQSFQIELEQLESLEAEEKEERIQQLFQRIASELLGKLFPKKEKDIQFFHPVIPAAFVQDKIWLEMNQRLSVLLYQLYKETKPLSDEHPTWATAFEQTFHVSPTQFLKIPITSMRHLLLANPKQMQQKIEETIKKLGINIKGAHLLGSICFSYGKDLILTKDPVLTKIGTFVERYFLERICFNVLQATQVDSALPCQNKKEEFPPLQSLLPETAFATFVNRLLACVPQFTQTHKSGALIQECCAILGFNKEESFPLPSLLKQKVWPFLKAFQTETLPALLAQTIDHQFGDIAILSHLQTNKQILERRLGQDVSLINDLNSSFLSQGFEHMSSLHLGKKISLLLPETLALTEEQREQFAVQLSSIFHPESVSGQAVKNRISPYLQGIVFQVFAKLCKKYEENSLNKEELSFPAWVLQEILEGCQQLQVKKWSEEKRSQFQEAIELKNVLYYSTDEVFNRQKQMKLDVLWKDLQIDFQPVAQHLLQLSGYQASSDLPLPKFLQSLVWDIVQVEVSKQIFKQIGNLVLLQIEKKHYAQEISTFSYGDQLVKGCQLLTQDVFSVLPRCINSYHHIAKEINQHIYENLLTDDQTTLLAQKIRGLAQVSNVKVKTLFQLCESLVPLHDPYTKEKENFIKQNLKNYKEQLLDTVLTVEKITESLDLTFLTADAKAYIRDQIYDFFQQKPSFASLWGFVDSYLESLLLKVVVHLLRMDLTTREILQELVLETGRMIANKPNEEALPILTHFIDEIFRIAKIEGQSNLFGIPPILNEKIMRMAKKRITNVLLKIHHSFFHISHFPVFNESDGLSISQVSQATSALTDYAFERVFNRLTKKTAGKFDSIPLFYQYLDSMLENLFKEKDIQIADLGRSLLQQQIAHPFLESALEEIKTEPIKEVKRKINEYVNPLLTAEVLRILDPLLKFEQNDSLLDLKLIKELLPILIHHLKDLNQANLKTGGLTFENFTEIAGANLHPAIIAEGNEEEKKISKEKFYQHQTKQILKLFFPQGKRDLLKLIPDLPPDIVVKIWRKIRSTLVSQIPNLLPALFEEKVLTEMINKVYENILISDEHSFEEAQLLSSELKNVEEKGEQQELNRLLGEFCLETACLLNLPVNFLDKIPAGLKHFIGVEKIKAKTFEAIGSAMRKYLEDKLANKSVVKGLPAFTQKTVSSCMNEQKLETQQAVLEHAYELESQLVKKGIQAIIHMIKIQVERISHLFPQPYAQKINAVILAVGSFVIVKCIGAFLHFFKLDQLILNGLSRLLRKTRQNIVEKLNHADIHENLFFKEAEALETILNK